GRGPGRPWTRRPAWRSALPRAGPWRSKTTSPSSLSFTNGHPRARVGIARTDVHFPRNDEPTSTCCERRWDDVQRSGRHLMVAFGGCFPRRSRRYYPCLRSISGGHNTFISARDSLAVFCLRAPRDRSPGRGDRPPPPRAVIEGTCPQAKELRMARGKVKWFSEAKGFGFITQDEGEDVFVSVRAIQETGLKTLAEGEAIEFDVTRGPKGLQASNVRKV